MTLALADSSFVGEALSDAVYRFPKWWCVAFWRAWYPGAFYYQWVRDTGGCGPARWMWRIPKNPRWRAATDWWVFRG